MQATSATHWSINRYRYVFCQTVNVRGVEVDSTIDTLSRSELDSSAIAPVGRSRPMYL